MSCHARCADRGVLCRSIFLLLRHPHRTWILDDGDRQLAQVVRLAKAYVVPDEVRLQHLLDCLLRVE